MRRLARLGGVGFFAAASGFFAAGFLDGSCPTLPELLSKLLALPLPAASAVFLRGLFASFFDAGWREGGTFDARFSLLSDGCGLLARPDVSKRSKGLSRRVGVDGVFRSGIENSAGSAA